MANKPDGKKKKSNDKSQKGVKPVAQAKPPKAVKPKGAVPDFRKKEDRLTPAEKIEISFGKASNELGRMANGFEGIYGIKSPSGDELLPEATVIIEVANHNDKAVYFVLESTMPGLPARNDLFLPVSTLRSKELHNFIGNEKAFAWQNTLWHFMKQICAPYLVVKIEGLAAKLREEERQQEVAELLAIAAANAPAAIQKVKEEKLAAEKAALAGAILISTAAFLHGRNDQDKVYVHKDENSKEAYFRAEVAAGNPALTLIFADEGHELHRVRSSQRNDIRVHLQTLHADTKPYGDLSNMRNARECVRQFLKGAATSLGFKSKVTKPATQEVQELEEATA